MSEELVSPSLQRVRLRSRQGGFTLLELLIALAISSVVLTIFVQSLSQQARMNTRIRDAAARALSRSIEEARFRTIIDGLTPAWPEAKGEFFVGTAGALRGLTRTPLSASRALVPVFVTIEPVEPAFALRYKEGATDWTIARFSAEARFTYLGADGVWYDAWPPEENPDPGSFGDAAFFETPQLPRAVRLETGDSDWIAPVGRTVTLPVRERDLLPGTDGLSAGEADL
ncbi:MAG: prepilin-type N-terminal cleavage/methylation domain-containing protein [Parvularculaceae bacterium]|nr:prepilin-type N-terminal cleavage/methylation domain-containing protein [Parvularculaceae bacterium]